MTIWGRQMELDAYRNMLKNFPQGVVTVVSDSYDIYHACEELWGVQLRNDVIRRGEGGGGEIFIRSDSGKLPDIIVEVRNEVDASHYLASEPSSAGIMQFELLGLSLGS